MSEHSDLVSEFIESLEKFSCRLLSVKDDMNNHLVLTETEHAVYLDSIRTAADYKTASKPNSKNISPTPKFYVNFTYILLLCRMLNLDKRLCFSR